jgi:hypothetical protein
MRCNMGNDHMIFDQSSPVQKACEEFKTLPSVRSGRTRLENRNRLYSYEPNGFYSQSLATSEIYLSSCAGSIVPSSFSPRFRVLYH